MIVVRHLRLVGQMLVQIGLLLLLLLLLLVVEPVLLLLLLVEVVLWHQVFSNFRGL